MTFDSVEKKWLSPCGEEQEVVVTESSKPFVVYCSLDKQKSAAEKIRVINRNPEENRKAVLHINEVKAYALL